MYLQMKFKVLLKLCLKYINRKASACIVVYLILRMVVVMNLNIIKPG